MTTRANPNLSFFRDHLSQFVNLTDEEFNDASQVFHYKTLKKRDHWLVEGEICKEVVFIIKGCLRYYQTKDGVEKTTEIFFENRWFTDFQSWLTKQPIIFSVDALEDTEMLTVTFKDLDMLYAKYPKCERIGRLIAENTIILLCDRFNSLLTHTPFERYLKLLEEQPEILDRIPQYYVASYLGIEPESLSRIRRKLLVRQEA